MRWALFASAKDAPASFRDIPFPVAGNDASASLTDVVLYGTKVSIHPS